MENDKLDTKLQLYLQLYPQYREMFQQEGLTEVWELLVKYHGDLREEEKRLGFQGEYLYGDYGVIFIPYDRIQEFSLLPQVDFIQFPNRIWYTLQESRREICLSPLQNTTETTLASEQLFGEGVLIAVLDSSIDYAHPDFRNADGSTRILGLWDQTISSTQLNQRQDNLFFYEPPAGYGLGTFFSEEMINTALEQPSRREREKVVPTVDISGHGTHVAGIACGNGTVSGGRYRGVAPRSGIVVVKLGDLQGVSFPRTTRLMEAIDFVVSFALERQMPVAINVSFGNNAGPHTGWDLISQYINNIAGKWKNVICVGTGNEGNRGRHVRRNLMEQKTEIVELAIPEGQQGFSLEIWTSYEDEIEITILAPNGQEKKLNQTSRAIEVWNIGNSVVGINQNGPSPFQTLNEIYMEWLHTGTGLEYGIWKFRLEGKRIVCGRIDFWMQTGNTLLEETRFLEPTTNTTLTTPASAHRVISVAAYDAEREDPAAFSGRGYTRNEQIKPDLSAPGVNIISASPNNGYSERSGTSMATPFVTGAAALLMEWGIIRQNDPYLYGEKVKAYLRKGARRAGEERYPNEREGYGRLCVFASFPR